jgi:hypothetical protein
LAVVEIAPAEAHKMYSGRRRAWAPKMDFILMLGYEPLDTVFLVPYKFVFLDGEDDES